MTMNDTRMALARISTAARYQQNARVDVDVAIGVQHTTGARTWMSQSIMSTGQLFDSFNDIEDRA